MAANSAWPASMKMQTFTHGQECRSFNACDSWQRKLWNASWRWRLWMCAMAGVDVLTIIAAEPLRLFCYSTDGLRSILDPPKMARNMSIRLQVGKSSPLLGPLLWFSYDLPQFYHGLDLHLKWCRIGRPSTWVTFFGGPKGALKATLFNEGMAFEHFDNDDGVLQKQN